MPRLRLRLAPLLAGAALASLPWTAARAQIQRGEDPINLEPVVIDAKFDDEGYDATGMGAQEAELRDPPFSNDLLTQPTDDANAVRDLNIELAAIAVPNPADLVSGLTRLNLRGFPIPRLRNGFIQTGVPEILNAGGGERIQGPLTPVTGRGAPGGIDNVTTSRPRATPLSRIGLTTSSARERSATVEYHAPVVPKKAWQRWAASWREKNGPEAFSANRTLTVSGALTVRHSRAASTLFQVDYAHTDATPGSGVPEYRLSRTSPVAGPYLPLAYLNVGGPDAGIRKRVASASAQFEAQAGRALSIRALAQWFRRELVEDRFTRGEFLVDERVFAGVREPQHQEQPLEALVAGLEATWRLSAFRAEHKLQASLEASRVDYTRLQRGLDAAERASLPATVRRFDPFAPDYYLLPYGPGSYRRLIADRTEVTTYGSAAVTERAAIARGRTVLTAGIRQDWVDLDVEDRRPGLARPEVSDRVSQLTWLAGANHQLAPGRLLLFANTSTAWEPSSRVDSRTSRIQGNETTYGYEAGLKGLGADRRLSWTLLGFYYVNDNISRRNPLYDDPIADADQTQPQLVTSGEERFAGGSLDLRFALSPSWVLTGRGTFTDAVTTASPDLPEEVGRRLTRLPAETLALGARYQAGKGRWEGFSASGSLTYVGSFVASYAERNRLFLEFPSYTLLGTTLSYSWARTKAKAKTVRHSASLAVRNLLDADLLARTARPGQGRAISVGYGATF